MAWGGKIILLRNQYIHYVTQLVPLLMLSAPKNTWHCTGCNFYVFNTKQKCDKCSAQKPLPNVTKMSYDPHFDKSVADYWSQHHFNDKTNCAKCIAEGRIFNKDPLKSNHNCWKYS